MAQSIFLPSPSLNMGQGIPSSPDPTPLRLLAFSVAEAALQSDPNSPSFTQIGRMPDIQLAGEGWEFKAASRSRLWDVAERAKTRKSMSFPPPQLIPLTRSVPRQARDCLAS